MSYHYPGGLVKKMDALSLARILAVITLTTLIGSLLLLQVPPKAFARQAQLLTPPQPHTDWSYYISYLDTRRSTGRAYDLGCNQGKFDRSFNPPLDSQVILDFGGQQPGGVGTYLVYSNTPASNAQIEIMAEEFAHGYWVCTGTDTSSHLWLDVGTNNSAYDVSDAGGRTWANVVAAAAAYNHSHGYDSQVTTWGADDIELAWSSASAAKAWANGFNSHGSLKYVDFGDANGCPPIGGCANGWTQADVAYVSWQVNAALAAPEIYNYGTAQEWASLHHHGGPGYFEGPLDQGTHAGAGVNYDAAQAWSALGNLSGASMLYSLEIHCELPPAPTPSPTGCAY